MNEPTTQPKTRGRKHLPFTFPAGEFTVKELATKLNVSIPFIHIRMTEAGDKVKKVRENKVAGKKGRSPGVYEYQP